MTTQEIYTLANELTDSQVNNIVAGWEKDNETKTLEFFNSLIKLGDSNKMACATTIANKYSKKEVSEMYNIAYNL